MKVTRAYREDLAGKRFGRLTVLGLTESRTYPCGTTHRHWLCRCDCGKITVVSQSHLKTGKVKSCGCLNVERIREPRVTFSHKRIHRIWKGMKDRCLNPNYHSYSRYGGRGITICDEWINDSNAFERWAVSNGYSDEFSIDRIDNDKGYSPDNCRWVDKLTQQNNTSSNLYLQYAGRKLTASEWARQLGISRDVIYERYKKGLPIEKVLER